MTEEDDYDDAVQEEETAIELERAELDDDDNWEEDDEESDKSDVYHEEE